jgi:hypothetical protein
MRFRKLRIAWSVFCGIACVLLIVLWVRSYSTLDLIQATTTSRYFDLSSLYGELRVMTETDNADRKYVPKWSASSWEVDSGMRLYGSPAKQSPSGFYLDSGPTIEVAAIPTWFAFILCCTCTIAPWLPRWSGRFSLRTLLITTTLVAVLLGLAVYGIGQ